MSDHDTYRRLMHDTQARAPKSAVGRFMARTWNRFSPERPDGMYSPQAERDMLRGVREVASDPAGHLRRRQAEVEAEMVRTGEISFEETSIPVHAGIENVKERTRAHDRERRREAARRMGSDPRMQAARERMSRQEQAERDRRGVLARRLAGDPRLNALLGTVRENERQYEAAERQRLDVEADAQRRVLDDMARLPPNAGLPSTAERLELLRGVQSFATNETSQAWLRRREAEVLTEHRNQLLRAWMRRDSRTGKEHPVYRRNFWR